MRIAKKPVTQSSKEPGLLNLPGIDEDGQDEAEVVAAAGTEITALPGDTVSEVTAEAETLTDQELDALSTMAMCVEVAAAAAELHSGNPKVCAPAERVIELSADSLARLARSANGSNAHTKRLAAKYAPSDGEPERRSCINSGKKLNGEHKELTWIASEIDAAVAAALVAPTN
jgi:hypothetical protein